LKYFHNKKIFVNLYYRQLEVDKRLVNTQNNTNKSIILPKYKTILINYICHLLKMKMKNWSAHLALSFVSLFYGLNYIIAKEAMQAEILPLTLTFLRIFCVFVLLWLAHLVLKNKEKVDRKDIFKLFICGLTGCTINQSFFLLGLSKTSPINAAIIVICTPVVVLLFSYLMLKEKITLKKAIGIFLGLAGSLILILGGAGNENTTGSLFGNLLIAVNVISYSFYLVYVKSLMAKYKPFTVLKWVFLFGLIGFLPFAINDVLQTNWQSITPKQWLAISYVILFGTLGTYSLNIYALKRVNASLVGFYIYFQLIIATTFAIIIGRDSLDWIKIISSTLIFIAIFMVSDISFSKQKKVENK